LVAEVLEKNVTNEAI